jgi:hypothetical protein
MAFMVFNGNGHDEAAYFVLQTSKSAVSHPALRDKPAGR